MISHRTTQALEGQAYHKTMNTFGSYEKIREEPFGKVADTLKVACFPGTKAQNIQKVMRVMQEEHGKLYICFLK